MRSIAAGKNGEAQSEDGSAKIRWGSMTISQVGRAVEVRGTRDAGFSSDADGRAGSGALMRPP